MNDKYMADYVWAEDPVIQACANYLNVNIWVSVVKGSDISFNGNSSYKVPRDQWYIYRPGNYEIVVIDSDIISKYDNYTGMIKIGEELELDEDIYKQIYQHPQTTKIDNLGGKKIFMKNLLDNYLDDKNLLNDYRLINANCEDTNSIYIQNIENKHFIALDHIGFKREPIDGSVKHPEQIFGCEN